MLIKNVITNLINYYSGIDFKGNSISSETTRDKVLSGSEFLDQSCSGIVTSCWASVSVIDEAIELGANLIICHEAVFWNHGDKTDWLKTSENETFLEKKIC